MKLSEIDKKIYGKNGVVEKIKVELSENSIGEISKKTGVSTQYLNVVRYHPRPGFEKIVKIADGLGIEI